MNGHEEISHTENFKQREDLSLQFITFSAFPKGSSFAEATENSTVFRDVTPLCHVAVVICFITCTLLQA
jgi:hypothetical protein